VGVVEAACVGVVEAACVGVVEGDVGGCVANTFNNQRRCNCVSHWRKCWTKSDPFLKHENLPRNKLLSVNVI